MLALPSKGSAVLGRERERQGGEITVSALISVCSFHKAEKEAGMTQIPREAVHCASVIAIRPSHFLCQLTYGELKALTRLRSGNS